MTISPLPPDSETRHAAFRIFLTYFALKLLLPAALFIGVLLFIYRTMGQGMPEHTISYSEFKQRMREGEVLDVGVAADHIRGMLRTPTGRAEAFRTSRPDDPTLIMDMDKYKVPQYGAAAPRVAFQLGFADQNQAAEREILYSEFKRRLRDNQIQSVVVHPDKISGTIKTRQNDKPLRFRTVPIPDPGLKDELKKYNL